MKLKQSDSAFKQQIWGSWVFPCYKDRMVTHFLMLMPLLLEIRISLIGVSLLGGGFALYTLAFYLEKIMPSFATKKIFNQMRLLLGIAGLFSWFAGLAIGCFLYLHAFFLSIK